MKSLNNVVLLQLILIQGLHEVFGSSVDKSTEENIFSHGDDDPASDSASVHTICSNHDSFLGVGNSACIHLNMGLSAAIVFFIISVSIVLDFAVEVIRHGIKCPQMRKIVNRIFEEVMILGFISMLLFSLDTFGVITDLARQLTDGEERHFREFFHFLIFFSTVYYILVMLLLLGIGTIVPRWIWNTLPEDDEALLDRRYLAMTCKTMYKSLCQRYNQQTIRQKISIWNRIDLWKSQQMLAYHVCRDRSRAIYLNPSEMQRIFDLSHLQSRKVDYIHYNKLCMRYMLSQITTLHWSGYIVLIGVVLLTSSSPENDEYIFVAIGLLLLLLSIVIMIKISQILEGIIKDRFSTITQEKIDKIIAVSKGKNRRVGKKQQTDANSDHANSCSQLRQKPTFKAIAISVRAIIRMKMSTLCHQGLHRHDHLFWFESPMLILRMFQFASFGQAFYLVWFSLVHWHSIIDGPNSGIKLFITLSIPIISLFVILPFTIPSLVLVLSLTGFFVEKGHHPPHENEHDPNCHKSLSDDPKSLLKDHIRIVRQSYIKQSSNVTDHPILTQEPIKTKKATSNIKTHVIASAAPSRPEMITSNEAATMAPISSRSKKVGFNSRSDDVRKQSVRDIDAYGSNNRSRALFYETGDVLSSCPSFEINHFEESSYSSNEYIASKRTLSVKHGGPCDEISSSERTKHRKKKKETKESKGDHSYRGVSTEKLCTAI